MDSPVTVPAGSYDPMYSNTTEITDHESAPKLKLFMAFLYSFLTLAIIFNLRVIYMVICILIRKPSPGRHQDGNRHAFVYVLSLSIVDSLVLAHLPFIVTDIVLTKWIFGNILCKLYWLLEHVNRILSTFILTALSVDRYLAVCRPMQFGRWRNTSTATCVIIACVLIAACMLTPLVISSKVIEYHIPDTNRTTQKCFMSTEMSDGRPFMIYTFVCGYCIPLISMVFFYGSILSTLWFKHSQPLHLEPVENSNGSFTWANHSHRRHRRAYHVTKRALILVLFYFACWTPYWIVQFYIEFLLHESQKQPADGVYIAIYMVHILVYVNSAVNPFLYALLNKELQRQHSSLHRHHSRDRMTNGQQSRDSATRNQTKSTPTCSTTLTNGTRTNPPFSDNEKLSETGLRNGDCVKSHLTSV